MPTFIGKIPVGRGTVKKFAVLARPRVLSYKGGSEGRTIISEVDRKIRVEIPAGVFEDNVDINMQVTMYFTLN